MTDTATAVTGHVAVLDLIGVDVARRRAQVRRHYPDDPGWKPLNRTLIAVETHYEKVHHADAEPAEWVTWRWEPDSTRGYDCGYSGMTVDLARQQGRTIEFLP